MQRIVECFNQKFHFEFFQHKYGNGRIAIQVGDTQAKEQFGTMTVNVPHVSIGDDEIIVKTYSENEHWVHAILKQMPDVFEDTGRRVDLNWVEAEVWKLKQPLKVI